MTNKLKLVGVGAALLLVVGLIYALSVQADGGVFKVSRDASLLEVVQELQQLAGLVEPQPEESLGAISSPDLPYNYIGVGGLREVWLGGHWSATTTDQCILDPDFGTTTVQVIAAQTVGTSSATVLYVSKSTNDTSASTTLLYSQPIAAEIKATIFMMASTTDTQGAANNGVDGEWTLGPDDTLNFSWKGLVQGDDPKAIGQGFNLGTCGAKLLVH